MRRGAAKQRKMESARDPKSVDDNDRSPTLAQGGMAQGGDAMRARFQTGTEVNPTLAEVGIDKKLSMRSQQLAAKRRNQG